MHQTISQRSVGVTSEAETSVWLTGLIDVTLCFYHAQQERLLTGYFDIKGFIFLKKKKAKKQAKDTYEDKQHPF